MTRQPLNSLDICETAIHSRASIEKERLRRVAYEANGIKAALDLLEDSDKPPSLYEKAVYTLLRKNTNSILSLTGDIK